MSDQEEIPEGDSRHGCLVMLVRCIMVIIVLIYGILCYKARDRVIDYPDEDRDWHGIFLGHEAVRARHVYHSGSIWHHPEQRYYAEIQVDSEKFSKELEGWKSDPEAAFKKWNLNLNRPLLDAPAWFPKPTQEDYVGDFRDSYSQVRMFKSPESHRVFLIVD